MDKAVGRYAYRAHGITDDEYKAKREQGFLWCSFHLGWLPGSEFMRASVCRECAKKYQTAWYEKNKGKHREYYWKDPEKSRRLASESYKRRSPDTIRARARKQKLRSYGVDQAWYDAKLAEQNGVCAVCGIHSPNGKYGVYMNVDHNHATQKSRGILCGRCNMGVGFLEAKDWLTRAMKYLQIYEMEHDMTELWDSVGITDAKGLL